MHLLIELDLLGGLKLSLATHSLVLSHVPSIKKKGLNCFIVADMLNYGQGRKAKFDNANSNKSPGNVLGFLSPVSLLLLTDSNLLLCPLVREVL